MTIIKHIILLLISVAFTTTLHSAPVNVFHNSNDATIIINGKDYKTNAVYNLDLNPGTHLVQVKVRDKIVYSKVTRVIEGETHTIDTNTFIDVQNSDLPNLGASEMEVERLMELRGDLGIGVQFGTISGLSVKKYFDKVGLQLTGWVSSSSDDTLGDKSYYAYNIRALYDLKRKLLKKDTVITLFTGIGYGNSKESFSNALIDDHTKQVFELLLGVEYSSWSFGVSYRTLEQDRDENYYYYLDEEDKTGFAYHLGYHYYF